MSKYWVTFWNEVTNKIYDPKEYDSENEQFTELNFDY